MKRLLNTLYVTGTNRYLSLDGENVVVLEEREEIGRVPLHNLQSIVTFGYTGASPALMGACAQRNIDLTFMSGNGRFLARVTGEVRGNVTLRKQQYRISENKEKSIAIARNFIFGKVYNARWILERAARDYPMRLDAEKLKEKSALAGSLFFLGPLSFTNGTSFKTLSINLSRRALTYLKFSSRSLSAILNASANPTTPGTLVVPPRFILSW